MGLGYINTSLKTRRIGHLRSAAHLESSLPQKRKTVSKYQTHSRLSIYGEEDVLERYLKIRCVGSRMQEQVAGGQT